mgnify:CR=1 FL=1
MSSEVVRLLSMVAMLVNMCNSNDFNKEQCLKDWDQWLYPEIHRAWEIKTRQELPYQDEKEVLESTKEENT